VTLITYHWNKGYYSIALIVFSLNWHGTEGLDIIYFPWKGHLLVIFCNFLFPVAWVDFQGILQNIKSSAVSRQPRTPRSWGATIRKGPTMYIVLVSYSRLSTLDFYSSGFALNAEPVDYACNITIR